MATAGVQSRSIKVGNSHTDVAFFRGRQLCLDGFPSVQADDAGAISFDGLNSGTDMILEMDGRRIAIGDSAFKVSTIPTHLMGRDRVSTAFFRSLFVAALCISTPKSGDVSVILSLPLSWYEDRKEVKMALEQTFDVCWNGERRVYNVVKVRIVPEGFGALCASVLDRQGNVVADESLTESMVGVIEIGGDTTDAPLFDALQLVSARSITIRAGLRDVWEPMQITLGKLYHRDFALHEVDAIIQAGGFYQGSDWIDIGDMAKPFFASLARKINAEISNAWANGKAARRMILAGGGALHEYDMKDLLAFPNLDTIKYADEIAQDAAMKKTWAGDIVGNLFFKALKDIQEAAREE